MMRWKILEIAKTANTLEDILFELDQSDHFDISREDCIKLLREYSPLLPEKIARELSEYEEKT